MPVRVPLPDLTASFFHVSWEQAYRKLVRQLFRQQDVLCLFFNLIMRLPNLISETLSIAYVETQ
jgi:hypothetical protein